MEQAFGIEFGALRFTKEHFAKRLAVQDLEKELKEAFERRDEQHFNLLIERLSHTLSSH